MLARWWSRASRRLSQWPRASRLRAGILFALVLVYSVGVTVAVGEPAAETHLNDGSVWVTRSTHDDVTRFDRQINQLDAQVTPQGAAPNVVQDGYTVFSYAADRGELRQLGVQAVTLANPVKVPPGSLVSLGGGTVSIASAGRAWIVPASEVSGYNPKRPTLTNLGSDVAGYDVGVGVDGVAHAYSVSDQTMTDVSVSPGASPVGHSQTVTTAPGSRHVTVTAVGGAAAVLDADRGTLTVEGQSPVSIPMTSGRPQDIAVQQPGPASSVVYVASDRGLYAVPVRGGAVHQVWAPRGSQGVPAQPVFVDGCVNAAWAATGRYVYSCSGGPASDLPIPGVSSSAELVFRVNRDVVVLNDVADGEVWVRLGHNVKQEADWNAFEANLNPQFKVNPNSQGPSNVAQQNRPPKAADVTLGARAGRTTDLPVLLFDSDPNNGVLTITAPASIPSSEGVVQIADHGTTLQYTPAPGQTGSFTVPYTIIDGLGGSDTATANLTVNIDGAATETPPTQVATPPVSVTQGKAVHFNALATWYDHEGDPFDLTGASATGGNAVSFSPNGDVTFLASGSPGLQTLNVRVTDGPGQVGTGSIQVNVGPPGQLEAPQTTPFLAQAVAGVSTAIAPLKVDSDPNDVPLRMSSVTVNQQSSGVAGLVVVPDYQNGQIQFLSSQPGTYYLQYVATDAPPTGAGLSSPPTTIRVDVANSSSTGPLVAVRHTAELAPGGSALVPVLDGASNGSGGVLVVQSVSAPVGSPVQASVSQGSAVRVSTNQTLTSVQVLSYTISDGSHSATAELDVLPSPPSAPALPPIAEPISIQARAGDVAQIDPLMNDFDPAGTNLALEAGSVSIDNNLSTFPGQDKGAAFIDAGLVRYRAPNQPGQATVLYGVVDAAGQVANSSITVTVTPDQVVNQPPTPGPVTASVVAGAEVTIPIALAGADPNGESVVLLGNASAPQLGRVVAVNTDSLVYQAFPASRGTDTFDYAVRDSSGLVGQGVVRVGVAPAALLNEPPVAVPQTVSAQPGQSLLVPVLAQDFDPQGYAVSFAPGTGLVLHGLPSGSASIAGTEIDVKGPPAGQQGTVDYTITDGHGASATGELTVVGSKSQTEQHPPIAHDIVIPYLTDPTATTVVVEVLSHVTDPVGTSSDLRLLSVVGGVGSNPVMSGGQVTVRLAASQYQVLVYTVSGVGGMSSATITLPPKGTDGPELRAKISPITTPVNTPVTVSIDSYLFDPGGKSLRITSAADVSAANGSPQVVSPTSVTFVPQHDFVGPASLTVTVTNGYGADDPMGQKGTFTLPVTVTGAMLPQFYGPTVNAVLGQTTTVDLLQYASNGSGGTSGVSFSQPINAVAGLNAAIHGTTLTVVPQGSLANTSQLVNFTMSGLGGQAPGAVDVVVVASSKPLAVAVPQTASVFQGKSVTISVLQQDLDPFPTPLTVASPTVTSGTGQGIASTDGTTVTFTADSSFSGTAIVQYTLIDQTRDPSRRVVGIITITVSGRPDAPGAPDVLGFGNGTALLSWSAPKDNGQPITGYTVSSGAFSQACPGTTCNISGLQNGSNYQFVVVAQNAVGTGPPSQPSAPVTPNIVPGTPAPPTTMFGNASVTVTWTAPVDQGTPITCYQLQISPPTGSSPACIGATSPNYDWAGLTNGDSYTFSVRAMNSLGWGPYSAPSNPQIPAGAPTTPSQPSATAVPNDPTGGKVDVSWPAVTGAAANGDAVSTYSLNIYTGSTLVRTDTVTPTSQTENPVTDEVSGLNNSTSYTFTVVATNKAGPSQPSPASAPFTVFGQPGAPTNLQAADHQNQQSQLSFTAPNANGQAIQYYMVSVNGGAFSQLAANNIVTGLTNGQQYTFVIEACNAYCGPPSSPSNTVTPDAAPNAPAVNGSTSGTTFNFNWGASTSNGCPISSVGYALDAPNGPWTPTSAGGGSASFNENYNQTHTLYVYVQDSCGLSSTSSGQATSGGPPTSVTVSRGNLDPSTGAGDCGGYTPCYWVAVNASGFPPNSGVTFTCSDSGGQFWVDPGNDYGTYYSQWYSTDGSGAVSWNVSGSPAKSCNHTPGGPVTVTITVNGVTGSGTVNPF